MRIRKNYRNLTDSEREQFVHALHKVKADGTVDEFARIHERHFFHGIHRSSHFLPWHREFIRRFEDALRVHVPEVNLPYWDSTVDQSPSDPLWHEEFLGQFDAAWNLGRVLGRDVLPTERQVTSNQRRNAYEPFWRELETEIHNPPHRWVGGVMAGVASPGDPIFFLHHAWIDLLWAKWRAAHPAVPFTASAPGLGLHDDLMEYPGCKPAAVLDHHALGYRYDVEPAAMPRAEPSLLEGARLLP